ncbi:MAG: alternate-type signal peptide domain-containing protein [Cellulomonadaceae bacterium]|jgi:alternate signal-mediated exported protein|nr:alternate-type signal peptide domain-containing protein [Cellulomonadaceae bacterium]
MKRITKAAIATGGAAVLLLGGAGTLAYWTANGSGQVGALMSGDMSVTSTCSDTWAYTDASFAPLTPAESVEQGIVPGDYVQTTCTVTITGQGDHLKVQALVDATALTAAANGKVTGLTATTGTPTLTTANGATLGTDNQTIDMSTATDAVTLTVPLNITYPYGTVPTDGETAPDAQVTVVALDQAVTITATQVDPNA